MEKIAFVKLQHDKAAHWIPATEIKQETGSLAIYHEEKVVGRFDLVRVEHWALELVTGDDHTLGGAGSQHAPTSRPGSFPQN